MAPTWAVPGFLSDNFDLEMRLFALRCPKTKVCSPTKSIFEEKINVPNVLLQDRSFRNLNARLRERLVEVNFQETIVENVDKKWKSMQYFRKFSHQHHLKNKHLQSATNKIE